MSKDNFLYRQVYLGIQQDIMEGIFPIGEKLPSDEELCAKYKVSNITIKKAMELLNQEGYIRRVPGRGTYVQEPEKQTKYEEKQQANQKRIGFVLEHATTPFGLDMMYVLDQKATNAGYKLCIRYSYGMQEKETEEIRFLLSLNVCGLIIMPCYGAHYNTILLKLILEHFPVVLIDKQMEGIPVSSVRTDNHSAMCGLVSHLAQSGCRHIGLISIFSNGTTSLMEREEGFHFGMKKYGLPVIRTCELPFSPHTFLDNSTNKIFVEKITEYLIKELSFLDALICTEFQIVSSFVEAAKKLGTSIGGKLKVCCMDEDYSNPNGFYFTHMKQNEKEIASKAMDILCSQIGGTAKKIEVFEIPALFRQGKTT